MILSCSILFVVYSSQNGRFRVVFGSICFLFPVKVYRETEAKWLRSSDIEMQSCVSIRKVLQWNTARHCTGIIHDAPTVISMDSSRWASYLYLRMGSLWCILYTWRSLAISTFRYVGVDPMWLIRCCDAGSCCHLEAGVASQLAKLYLGHLRRKQSEWNGPLTSSL